MSPFRDPSTVFSWHRGDTSPVVAAKEIVFAADKAGTSAKILMRVDGAIHEFWSVVAGTSPVTSVFGRTGAVVAATSDYDAIQVDYAPYGNIAATNVQAAINELDDEKAALAHTHDHDTAEITNTGSNTHAQIDTHIADSTIHFTEASIDHDNILNNGGAGSHAAITAHIADVTTNPHAVTFTQSVAEDAGTDISAAECETLTDGSNADLLHDHTITEDEVVLYAVRRDLVNGTFVESFNALATSDGATVTLSLEQSGGGDLTMQFSDGDSTLDCTPADTVTLTAGSDSSPTENFVYVLQSTKALTVSTADWPATEHIKVAYLFVPSATYVQSDGCYINQNWNDHISGTDNMGHIAHMAERSRRDGAYYFSGVDGNGTDGYLTPTASNVELKATAGVIYQMHKHSVPAFDTSGTDDVHVVNWFGDAYHDITNLFDITADSTGTTIGNNKYFNLFLWGVANKTGEYAPMMINLPSGFYNSQSDAENDVSGYTNTSIPVEFSGESSTGFPVAIITIQMKTTWIVTLTQDVRMGVGGGGGGAVTAQVEFADNTFRIFDESDVTKVLQFQVSGVSAATTRTLTAPDASGTISLEGHTHDHSTTALPNLLYGGDRMDIATWDLVGTAVLNGNTATLAVAGDEVKHTYPGLTPQSNPGFLAGVTHIVRLAIKNASSGTQDGDVEVYFEDPVATTEWIAMTVAAADIEDDWKHFALTFTPGSDATGTLEYRARYLAGGALGADIGQAHVAEAAAVFGFGVSQREAYDGWTVSTVVPPPNATGFVWNGSYWVAETT